MGGKDISRSGAIKIYKEKSAEDSKCTRRAALHCKMVNGSLIFVLLLRHFEINEIDNALMDLNDLTQVQLKGDNLVGFLNDWEVVLAGIDDMPSEKYLENLFFKQLCTSKQLEQPMAFYKQDIELNGAPRS